jgi:uncharacterized membrane protein YphA (DoxX/SURF4 family)/peroxiredoxin
MHFIIILLRLALSVVFGTAAVTKLLDQRGTRDAVTNFGSPASLAPTISILLPIAEIGVCIGLLIGQTTRAGALAALLVLTLFIIAIAVNLARGRTHDCHCFGQLYSRPLGWPTLVRNLIFGLGAAFLWWQADSQSPDILKALATLSRTEWLLLFAGSIVAAGALVYALKRRPQERPAAPEGLPLDTPAPSFELAAYDGGTTSLARLLDYNRPLLLVFTNPTCGPCVALFSEIKEWQRSHSDRLTIALISFGTIKENFVNVARNDLGQVLLQQKREVAEQYGAKLTPTAVIVNPDGRIASRLAAGADEIRKLLTTIVGNSNGHGPP